MAKGSNKKKEPKTIGQLLKEAREKKKYSLEDVAEATNISIRNLKFIEGDQLDRLPAKVFARGYLKAYGKLVGEDVGKLLMRFEEQFQVYENRETLHPVTDHYLSQSQSFHAHLNKIAILIFLLILAAIGYWYLSQGKILSEKELSLNNPANQTFFANPKPYAQEAPYAIPNAGENDTREVNETSRFPN